MERNNELESLALDRDLAKLCRCIGYYYISNDKFMHIVNNDYVNVLVLQEGRTRHIILRSFDSENEEVYAFTGDILSCERFLLRIGVRDRNTQHPFSMNNSSFFTENEALGGDDYKCKNENGK